MDFLIYVDLLEDIKQNEKNILKYLFFKIPYMLVNNEKKNCNIYFDKNYKFYQDIQIKDLYYYLIKNSFILNSNKNYDESNYNNVINTKIKNLLLINNSKKSYLNKIFNNADNIIILNLYSPSIKMQQNKILKMNSITYYNINSLVNYSLEKNDFSLDNIFNNYPFLDYINDEKVKQHYNKFLSEDYNISLSKITQKNIKINKNKLINQEENNKSETTELNYDDLNDDLNDDENATDFFTSSVSMSNYLSEMENDSFIGIMINITKEVTKLVFIPHLLNTSFISDIISYKDFLDLRQCKLDELNNFNINKIKNNEIIITNIDKNNQVLNGLIPLYINSKHFKIIKKNIEKYISIIFTGHENGFDKRFIRIFYKILSDYIFYIYDLKKNNKLNDYESILFLNYFRFCCEITKTMGYHKGIYKYIESLDLEYRKNLVAMEYLISEIFCMGDNNLLNNIIDEYKILEGSTNNFDISIKIIDNIKTYFGSWTKFLNIFESNNGFFEDISFIKNIDI